MSSVKRENGSLSESDRRGKINPALNLRLSSQVSGKPIFKLALKKRRLNSFGPNILRGLRFNGLPVWPSSDCSALFPLEVNALFKPTTCLLASVRGDVAASHQLTCANNNYTVCPDISSLLIVQWDFSVGPGLIESDRESEE